VAGRIRTDHLEERAVSDLVKITESIQRIVAGRPWICFTRLNVYDELKREVEYLTIVEAFRELKDDGRIINKGVLWRVTGRMAE
jgi:hypothetical protein